MKTRCRYNGLRFSVSIGPHDRRFRAWAFCRQEWSKVHSRYNGGRRFSGSLCCVRRKKGTSSDETLWTERWSSSHEVMADDGRGDRISFKTLNKTHSIDAIVYGTADGVSFEQVAEVLQQKKQKSVYRVSI